VSGDVLYLAMSAARNETGATEEDSKRLLSALRREQADSMWPKGFMPEL
jgi:hypothetical protein